MDFRLWLSHGGQDFRKLESGLRVKFYPDSNTHESARANAEDLNSDG